MTDNETINQHYVPQTYLRRFANTANQIWVFDKAKSNAFQTSVRNVAAERRFYDSEEVKEITGDNQFIENHLINSEGHYQTVSNTLINVLNAGKFEKLKLRDRLFLSTYMILQMLRTKETRILHQHIEEAIDTVQGKAVRDAGLEPPLHTEFLDGRNPKSLARNLQLHSLLNNGQIQGMASILHRHIWVILEAFGDEEFITSDHPFVKRAHITGTWRSMSGIASEGIEILFPLSPKYIITLVDRNHFAKMESFDGKRMLLGYLENMLYYNQFQIKQSNRFIFSQNGNFDFVKTVIQEEPIHGNTDRKRVGSMYHNEFDQPIDDHKSSF